VLLCFAPENCSAQLKGLGKRIERKVEERFNRRVDQATDKALDEVEGGAGDAVEGGEQPAENAPQNESGTAADPQTSPDATGNTSIAAAAAGPATFAVNTKFDYVPGEILMVSENFEQDAIGDFPSRWNTDGTGEVVTFGNSNEKWFMMRSGSDYIPDLPRELPEEYTIEFDVVARGLSDSTVSTTVLEVILDDNNAFQQGRNYAKIRIPFCQYHPVGFYVHNAIENRASINNQIEGDIRQQVLNRPHISIAVNKTRFRLWVNEKKYIDIPRLMPPGNTIKYLKFRTYYFDEARGEDLFMRNLKIAEGGLDLRDQLLKEGTVSTTGILFQVNSAYIQPESYGVIRQIALAMQENTSMKLNIIGHTDSDGSDTDNLSLSQQRAEAVKTALVNDFDIATDRLSVEGKGESQPVAENDSPEGKAANRRVEFVSL